VNRYQVLGLLNPELWILIRIRTILGSRIRIWIRIKVQSWSRIRIHNKVNSRIRIHIRGKCRIRIRNKVMRIRCFRPVSYGDDYIPFYPKIEYLEDKINYLNLYIYQYKNKSTIVRIGNNQNFCDI
jgi:hypothetical protein